MMNPHSDLYRRRRVRLLRVTKRYPSIEIKVTGDRDPRGSDNSIFIWLDEDDGLHIMTLKADRGYKFAEVIETESAVEVIQK